MTPAELLAALAKALADKDAEIATLKANQLPSGVVDIVISGVDMSKVTFS